MVNAICRNCNKPSPAEQFKLHYLLKMMVCQSCYSGKQSGVELQRSARNVKEQRPLPPGWDAEDDYLEKHAAGRKEENQVQFSRIRGTDHVRCTCGECKYTFKYDPFRKMPRTCPYCDSAIPKLKTFNLL